MHSGPVKGNANKVVHFNTSVLSISETYAVCYVDETDIDNTSSWEDSYIRLTLQRVESLVVADAIIMTSGILPATQSLSVEYTGSLGPGRWFSLVIESTSDGQLCLDVAQSQDQKHSGVIRAAEDTKALTFSTRSLSYSQAYAVCYAETNGTVSDVWVDSGIRLRFVGWQNSMVTRLVTGSVLSMVFQINTGTLIGDTVALLPAGLSCSQASSAPVKRVITVGENSTTEERTRYVLPQPGISQSKRSSTVFKQKKQQYLQYTIS